MKALYQDWFRSDYEEHNIRYCEPMTAHALEDPVDQAAHLNDPNSIIEEKFDGTRGILHFFPFGCRVFSRRISKKTNWFAENSDSLPQMRDLKIPELSGTVIDGEMFIPNRPFKDVSATLNCKWDKAIERQKELGEIVFHAFDILYYKGICIESMSLRKRKYFLSKVFRVLEDHGVKCIEEVPYYQCGSLFSPQKFGGEEMTTIQYYERIVETGGEGVIIKDLSMPYEHKRSKAFLKIKKFYTRECILLGFSEPTKYYDGKFPDDKWSYWESPTGIPTTDFSSSVSAAKYLSQGYKPLTKYYVNKWVGNMIFGVVITPDEVASLRSDKIFETKTVTIGSNTLTVLVIGECSGFDEDVRASLSDKDIGRVIEVKCNEIFKDTGKMRHPRFLRFREDKDPLDCTYKNHIEE